MGCFFLPGLIWMVVKRGGLRNQPHGALHVVWSLIFMLYGFMAVHLTAGIGTIWDLLAYGRLDNSINLIPLAAMDWWGYTLNAFMFMPLGFLLPLIWKSFRQAKKTVVFGFFLSLTIEVCQLFCFGCLECVGGRRSQPSKYSYRFQSMIFSGVTPAE